MDFRDVVRRRRMVRAFSDAPVAADAVDRMIDIARRGPSAGYSQGIEFVTVTEPPNRAAVARVVSENADAIDRLSRIPVFVVICTSPEIYTQRYRERDKQYVSAGRSDDDLWPVPYWHVDGGAALMLLLLATVNEGLSASFIGVRKQDELRQFLGIPETYTAIGIALIGHRAPDERPRGSATSRPRRPVHEIHHRERW